MKKTILTYLIGVLFLLIGCGTTDELVGTFSYKDLLKKETKQRAGSVNISSTIYTHDELGNITQVEYLTNDVTDNIYIMDSPSRYELKYSTNTDYIEKFLNESHYGEEEFNRYDDESKTNLNYYSKNKYDPVLRYITESEVSSGATKQIYKYKYTHGGRNGDIVNADVDIDEDGVPDEKNIFEYDKRGNLIKESRDTDRDGDIDIVFTYTWEKVFLEK